LQRLQRHVQATPNRVLIVAESEGRRESLLELLRDSRIEPPSVASLAEFVPPTSASRSPSHRSPRASSGATKRGAQAIEFVTETELFATPPTTRRRRKQEPVSDVSALIKDLSELNPGDPVVHVNHGIGRYVGLKRSSSAPATTARASSCTSSTPTRRPCTCRSRSST
jgi:transcription-repair coupling factor (superfamily II helicase)